MPSRASAARYARALFDVALKESDPAQIERDLASFAGLLSSNAELHGALTNPAVPVSAKRQIVDALGARLDAAPPARSCSFCSRIATASPSSPDVLARVSRAADGAPAGGPRRSHDGRAAAAGTRDANRTDARVVDGRKVDMKTHVDPAIIGGVVTRIGSTVYDGSIATQLTKLRERLTAR
jgi:F-type H+-transporting ATPase subunit delta